jgi:hypothetical protein
LRINALFSVQDITPLEFRPLQKIDSQAFGKDRFAFEMSHFIKTSSENIKTGSKDIAILWEFNFVKGLETLLVECAIVEDDIERECFVSRVYCWFTEKLTDRRDLPRPQRGKYV